MDILVSTLAFLGSSLDHIIEEAIREGYSIEFSSGQPFDPDAVEKVLQAPFTRFIHNYFPAPQEPFVLNLASSDSYIRSRSIAHCLQGLEISKSLKAPFFSAHAGFCIDPSPDQLGQSLNVGEHFVRSEHWSLFKDSLVEILAHARRLEIKFLIENNVLAPFNFHNGENPLLCCDGEEILKLNEEVSDAYLGFLFDTAHWKVSAGTLRFDVQKNLLPVLELSDCIHHSDNDGLKDTNGPLLSNYWFKDFARYTRHCMHVIEVKNLERLAVQNHLKFIKKIVYES